MKRLLIIALSVVCTTTFAQTTPQPATNPATGANAAHAADSVAQGYERPLDGYYEKSSFEARKPTPYPALRQADVIFAKRVWREIDVREKMNQYLASPKSRLIDVLMAAIDAGELTAYDPSPNPTKNDPSGDAFSTPLTGGQAKARMADSAVVDQFDADGNKIGSKIQAGEFNPDSVVKFRIKEDWVFDRQRSVFEPRIIGIAPLIKFQVEGLDMDYQPAFWVYFPEARQVLATKEAVSRNNDATGLSFDDVFLKRLFSSYIVKVSNDKDERIKDYAQGIDRLYESERIKKSLMDWELTLWEY
ncbi:gliding motility protein GldN [Mucilaginibacter roseus]|uniref:Gliding motility protein GldN n=1 Tax=Mucilaginibacter roseus TaxID=1528868 RepID=A0ABS8U8P8_9SPHI|nr:gliding motility protein GldN [Mucilaginibacter roseus]MCD8742374.1 gliding motility protein GldN [Mucilaginibacter roseus]